MRTFLHINSENLIKTVKKIRNINENPNWIIVLLIERLLASNGAAQSVLSFDISKFSIPSCLNLILVLIIYWIYFP